VLLLSYFFDRIDPFLLESEKKETVEIKDIASLATSVCLGRDEWKSRWGSNSDLMAELEDRPEWCLDLTFMHALLRLGYEFDSDREVRLGKRIEGTELGWCLGATIAMVSGKLTCRA
jgi:guanosine-diphosphatase